MYNILVLDQGETIKKRGGNTKKAAEICFRQHCWRHFSPILQTPGLRCAMASTSESSQRWERTTRPSTNYDKSCDHWTLSLRYTRPRQKPERVRSSPFKKRADAEAAQHSWRLSWELGLRGKPVTSANLPAEEPASGSGSLAAAPLILPAGKLRRV